MASNAPNEPAPPLTKETLGPRSLGWIGVLVAFVALCLVFHQSQISGGYTWDEELHRGQLQRQFAVAFDWIAVGTVEFEQIEFYKRVVLFYGTLPVVPASAAVWLSENLGVSEGRALAVFHYGLHATAFACGLLTLVCCYLILSRIARRENALLGTAVLALYPLWLGYTFFDFKDVSTASFALLALFAGVCLLQAETNRELWRFSLLLALATVLVAGTKLAAVALVLPSWVAALYALLRARMLRALLATCLLSAIGIILVTPVAWPAPISFFTASIDLMSHFPWKGCIKTAGSCMRPHTETWSAIRYLLDWFSVQLPILIGLASLASIGVALTRGPVPILIASSVIFPLGVILAKNSPLYDGIRHVLFVVPIIFILAIWLLDYLGERIKGMRWPVRILLALQIFLFVADNFSMFPYNYVYFNLVGRQYIDQAQFETDYWGFSLKEAASSPLVANSSAVFSAQRHLVEPFLPKKARMLQQNEVALLPADAPVVLISFTRWNRKPPQDCGPVDWVERSLPLSSRTMRLSFSALCKASAFDASSRSSSRTLRSGIGRH